MLANTHGKTATNAVNEALAWLPDSGDKGDNAKSTLQSGKVSIRTLEKYKVK